MWKGIEMKLACIADTHLRTTIPEKRVDDFKMTQLNKFEYILNYCKDSQIDHLTIAGDVFENPRQSLGYVGEIISLLKKYPVNVSACVGNHDQFFRNMDIRNTPLGLLKEAGVITILDENPIKIDNVHLYGCSWEQPIPKIVDESAVNVLVAHIMVINDKKVFHQQEEYITAGSLLKNNNFDLIVSGDNHQTFTELYKGRRLVNSGSMMRSSVAQKDHKPSFFVYDTDDKTLEQILIPCLPANEVLLVDKHEETKELNQMLMMYKNALKEGIETDFDFLANLTKKLKVIEVNDNVVKIIRECV